MHQGDPLCPSASPATSPPSRTAPRGWVDRSATARRRRPVGRPRAALVNDVDGEHIAAQDPARVLRQVRAHRAILDRYEFARSHPTSLVSSFVRGQDNGFWQGLEEAVKELVSIYSDRDGYNPGLERRLMSPAA
jgi:hypothetical protein